ncbi:DUF3793 family protein [Orenia marismortui]|uniref:DUF3793 family protein n=1 Tax=Orenia marismortui TaxID=46469 RepID=UPI00037FD4AB|nr:DUF3793 family protein [Orenia marismortui]
MRANLKNSVVCNKNYLKSLLEYIGATIMGVKPSELRNVMICNCGDCEYWKYCKKTILSYEEIGILELKSLNNKRRKKVIFYHQSSLNDYLQQKNNLKFLQGLGYPKEYNLELYLKHLKRRLESDKFPHEIGIFFGYPLKDVLAFMGYLDLEPSGYGEWKFYGNDRISKLQQKRFDQARKKFKDQLTELDNISRFYEAL